MEQIGLLLKNRKIIVSEKPQRRGNPLYGLAVQLQMDLGISFPMCFKLLKQHDIEILRQLTSWWRDYPFKKTNNYGLLLWKIKKLEEERRNVNPR